MDRLPDELVKLICEKLEEEKDLHSCSLTNRTLSRNTTPMLYKHCRFIGTDISKRGPGYVGEAGRHKLLLFLRTVCTEPMLAKHVNGVDIAPFDSLPPAALPNGFHAPLGEAANALSNTTIHLDLCSALSTSSLDAFTALLLSKLPQIAQLKICTTFMHTHHGLVLADFRQTLTMRMIEFACSDAALSGQCILPKLSSVHVAGPPLSRGPSWDVGLVPLFLRLPSLQELEAFGCGDSWICDFSAWSDAARTSKVKKLDFQSAELCTETLVTILNSCDKLEAFKFDSIIPGNEYNGREYHWPSVGLALQHHSRSLEVLELAMNDWVFPDEHPFFPPFSPGQLGSLENLNVLSLDIGHINKTNRFPEFGLSLPVNLHALTVEFHYEEDNEGTYRPAAANLQAIEQLFDALPKLSLLELRHQQLHDDDLQRVRSQSDGVTYSNENIDEDYFWLTCKRSLSSGDAQH